MTPLRAFGLHFLARGAQSCTRALALHASPLARSFSFAATICSVALTHSALHTLNLISTFISMDIDCVGSSRLAQQTAVAHTCNHMCSVQHEFGNVFVCRTSGLMHVCDSTCNQLVYADRYSMVCRISRKVFPVQTLEPAPCRKRACSVEHDVDDRDQQRIRRGFQAAHLEDSMVM